MNTGKVPFLEAVNGSDVLLPCIYASCIGIEKLYVKWEFNDNGTMVKVRPLGSFRDRTSVKDVKDFHSAYFSRIPNIFLLTPQVRIEGGVSVRNVFLSTFVVIKLWW